MQIQKKLVVLLADDDDDDTLFMTEAFQKTEQCQHFYRVRDGEELMDYLLHRGAFENPVSSPRPTLILLDLNMPRMDGREALRAIKSHPDLRMIPTVILSTSRADEDIAETYGLGANSFIQKPDYGKPFHDVIRNIADYWLGYVQMPI